MKINCTTCAAKYSIADERVAGKSFKIRCKKCSSVIVVRQSVAAKASLREQRNENSVLFSLRDVATLPMQAANQGSRVSATSSERKEGSGLVDIRAMASIYLADKGTAANDSRSIGGSEEVARFPQAGFESALPVLLPERAQRAGTSLLYALSGVAAALVIAAAVLLVLVLQGDGTRSRAEAETPPAQAIEQISEPAPVPPSAALVIPEDASLSSPLTDELALAEAPSDKPAPSSKKAPSKKQSTGKKQNTGKKQSTESETQTSANTCDEVTCLVSPEIQCCVLKENTRRARARARGVILDSDLQARLGRSDIQRGIAKVRPRFQSCASRHGGKGTLRLRMKIGGNGKVRTVRVSGGHATLRACVGSVAKRARFKKTQLGIKVNYPIVFR